MAQMESRGGLSRRDLLKHTGLFAAGLTCSRGLAAESESTAGVWLVRDPADEVANAPPAQWAMRELQDTLKERGVATRLVSRIDDAPAVTRCIVVAGGQNRAAQNILETLGAQVPVVAEGLGLAQSEVSDRPVLLACGHDVRGLCYAMLELVDRVRHAGSPLAALRVPQPIFEQPANAVRSIYRCFTSEIEDKPWFNDREMWIQYLTMLATQRFNRFSLSFGMGYNTPRNIRDSYFFFAYPFLVKLPDYDVQAVGLPDAERERNLDTLKFISDQTAARGLHFQLALWSHGRDWPESEEVNYPLKGLTAENHGPYCRDALVAVLKACPAISGVTFRVHGESGVPQGTYDFWKVLFEAFVHCGRRVEIDMHGKNITQPMIETALATGMPVNLSPKYWGEHMGLGYHQAAIRKREMGSEEYHEENAGVGLGSRSFTRYGFGDLMSEDRPYGILHRIWPGTQSLLLSGDPALAAGYGRNSSFCGSLGVERLDPLNFKGRKSSGHAGGRCAYADQSLHPKYDWQKFLYTYRLWGRLTFRPDSDPDVWRRYLRQQFGAADLLVEKALSLASRVLPLITTAHGPSANCMRYWPEVYTNQPIVDPDSSEPYGDTESPKSFGNVSPFDPQLFAGIDEYADALLDGVPLQKYTPIEVATWLEDLANTANVHLTYAEQRVPDKNAAAFRRLQADVGIQTGIALFFATKIRSAALWRVFLRSQNRSAFVVAFVTYREARREWAELAAGPGAAYVEDISFGDNANLRGHWSDRLPAIDKDLKDMEQGAGRALDAPNKVDDPELVERAMRTMTARPRRRFVSCDHTPVETFHPGDPVAIDVAAPKGGAQKINLYYRHVNQAIDWRMQPMQLQGSRFQAVIPAEYTQTRFPLEYYFGIDQGASGQVIYPGFNSELSNLPYYVIRTATKR